MTSQVTMLVDMGGSFTEPSGRFQEYPTAATAQAFQVEQASVRSNQQGVNFDLGSNISVDWVDLKMLTMISRSVAKSQEVQVAQQIL